MEVNRNSALSRVQHKIDNLRDHYAKHDVATHPVPLAEQDPMHAYKHPSNWAEWISGWNAFELLRLQTEPYEWAPPIARLSQIIADQIDREKSGLNYLITALPPNHALLSGFSLGSNHWFRALHILLSERGAETIDGWETLVSDLYDWIGPYGRLYLRTIDVFESAMNIDSIWHDIGVPEAKQEPIWSFQAALAWIATRDYLALARIGFFRRPPDDEEAAATNGVCHHNTKALGWLHSFTTFQHCHCGAAEQFGWAAFNHCTCISVAWEELVKFRGGLASDIPELVFNLQEGWLSMTWPDGADGIRFLRSDILERWPPKPKRQEKLQNNLHSMANVESDCREWLVSAFSADPEKQRSKKHFRDAALVRFPEGLSERGFNLRVWPELAREHGRDSAGAKPKS